MEKEQYKSLEPEPETDEEVFQRYVEDLGLKPEDFYKTILDVGAGSTKFAKWAKENGVSDQIYSVEPHAELLEKKDKSVSARAENLPFDDELFDLVVSVAAIPNVYMGGNEEAIKEKTTQAFNELARVVKKGGEIRLARVLMSKRYEPQRILTEGINEALQELEKKQDIQIEKIRTPSDDTYEYEGEKQKKLLAEAYLIIIHKH